MKFSQPIKTGLIVMLVLALLVCVWYSRTLIQVMQVTEGKRDLSQKEKVLQTQ